MNDASRCQCNEHIDDGRAQRGGGVIREGLGVPPDHLLATLIIEALREPAFATSWQDEADTTLRPYATAVRRRRFSVAT
jgi:hypothetical protein